MSDALQFLKSKGILHRDVKPSNILVKQNPVVFKICDFGISGQLTNSVAHTMMKGTQVYLAVNIIFISLFLVKNYFLFFFSLNELMHHKHLKVMVYDQICGH